ncbi:MAG: segregation/condensation protein A [Planctomycetota bacterium]
MINSAPNPESSTLPLAGRMQDEYTIAIEAFQGPLDLLLYLIRRAEVDVHDIPISTITDQYLEFLHHFDTVDIDIAGEFLVMAATLVEIKSRSLTPATDGEDDDADGKDREKEAIDPRTELVQALLAYQRIRQASESLEEGRLIYLQRFPSRPARHKPVDEHEVDPVELELEDVHILDLAEAYEHIASSIDFTRLGEHQVEIDDTPIALHQADLMDRLHRMNSHALTLQDAFEGAPKMQRIGLFMATLELVRMRRITVLQDEINSPIELVLLDDSEDALHFENDDVIDPHAQDDAETEMGHTSEP